MKTVSRVKTVCWQNAPAATVARLPSMSNVVGEIDHEAAPGRVEPFLALHVDGAADQQRAAPAQYRQR